MESFAIIVKTIITGKFRDKSECNGSDGLVGNDVKELEGSIDWVSHYQL